MKVPAKYRATYACMMLVLILRVANPTLAATVPILDITGTGPRDYFDTNIWPSGALPTNVDQALIAFGNGIDDYVYISNANLQIQRFNIGNQNTGGFELRSGAYVLLNQLGGETNVGPSGSATGALPGVGYLRIQSNATLEQTGLMYVGLNTLGTGTVTLEQNATHIVGTNLVVGSNGTGTYNLQGTLSTGTSNVVLGNGTTGSGTFNMSGGSLTSTASNVIVGNAGTGTFNLSDGALTTGTYLLMGNTATGKGTFKQSGGTVQINRSSTTAHGLYLGFTAGSTALYEISDGTLNVAASNQGFMNGTNAAAGGSAATFRVVGSEPTITIGSHYIQRSGATLDMVIGATGVSPLNIGTTASLNSGSILKASFTATPMVGQQFTIMNYTGALTGTFSTFDSLVDSPLGPNSVQLSINYGTLSASSIVLTVDSLITATPGDFDGDGDVDGADFIAWQTNFPTGSGATRGQGDDNGDGDVDGADFAAWQSSFPTAPGPGTSPVPEPNAVILVATAGIGLIIAGRRHRRV